MAVSPSWISPSPPPRRRSATRCGPGWPSTWCGDFASLGTGGKLGEGDELDLRKAWERELASGGWVGMGWPADYGGRDLPLAKQIIFNEEYVRSGGPNRVGFFGEELLGPTLMMFGTDEQKTPVPAGHPQGRRVLVPGLQRTRRRFGPRQRQDDGGPRRRANGSSTGRRCGRASDTSRTGSSSCAAPTRTAVEEARRHQLPPLPRGPAGS